MATSSRSRRNRNSNSRQNQVNLVSARSRGNLEAKKFSRLNAADGYAELRKKRVRRKSILMGVSITLTSLLIAAVVAVAAYAVIINGKLGTDLSGNKTDFSNGTWNDIFKEPEKPEDPFWVLLMGTDDREGYEIPRTDTLILVHVDQANKRAAMISIPRDTYVNIPGYGYDKINAAYFYGELEGEDGGGTALAIKTVSEFANIDISYFAQINFEGLEKLVDDLGGVEVDVPVDIVGDFDASDGRGIEIYAGLQTLDGDKALVFCRSRNFPNGDYQRQADQRTFLQALAKQVLASDPVTIANTITNMADMTYTNMDLAKIIKVAQGMQGMQESGIFTYHVPSTTTEKPDGSGMMISYVVADDYAWQEMINAINAGEYPELQDDSYAGVIPESYMASNAAASDQLAGQSANLDTSAFVIDVRNGSGINGSATSVSDMLSLAGYQHGEIGNADAYIYDTTLIIYKNDSGKAAANDIRKRLGYGKTLASLDRYSMTGDILVVVGSDFKG